MSKQQRGYTLIELMISLLLGLMLISGFGSLFVQMQKNATIQRSLSYMMDDGRYILEMFGKELRRTGSLRNRFDISGGGGTTSVFTADSNVFTTALGSTLGSTMDFSAGDYIKGEYNTAGFGAAADKPYNVNRLALRYQLNNSINPSIGKSAELASDGLGSANSACERSILLTTGEDTAPTQVHVVTLYFYVALDASNVPVLYCVAKRDNFTANTSVTSPTPEPLISNVQKLVITYGIDSDAYTGACYNSLTLSSTCLSGPDGVGDDGTANYYVDANSVTNWQQVVAAKLSVVLRSDDDNLTTNFVSYPIDGVTGSPFTATDHRLYRVSSTTIAFRNTFHNLIF